MTSEMPGRNTFERTMAAQDDLLGQLDQGLDQAMGQATTMRKEVDHQNEILDKNLDKHVDQAIIDVESARNKTTRLLKSTGTCWMYMTNLGLLGVLVLQLAVFLSSSHC